VTAGRCFPVTGARGGLHRRDAPVAVPGGEGGGRHSHLVLLYQYPRPGVVDGGSGQAPGAPTPADASTEAKADPAFPDGALLGRVAVLRVPAFSGDRPLARRYGAAGRAAVR
jgi:hypothetical protein